MKELMQKIFEFRNELGWGPYNEKDLAISISLEANELLENFPWRTSEEAVACTKQMGDLNEQNEIKCSTIYFCSFFCFSIRP
ncbi:hypothetical protein [Cytobacillus sp.]|uniref:hypothetical protein n=1 Tax=Cytobacillus sp. TaxID=2675269 RepID=UPI0037BFC761